MNCECERNSTSLAGTSSLDIWSSGAGVTGGGRLCQGQNAQQPVCGRNDISRNEPPNELSLTTTYRYWLVCFHPLLSLATRSSCYLLLLFILTIDNCYLFLLVIITVYCCYL